MKSQLWLYVNAPVDEESPAWIEGLSDGSTSVLGNAYPISDFIPFDPILDTTIRIDMDGYSFIKQTKNQVFNYCSVTYDGSDKIWYYFVRSAKWRANNTLALVLHMDVINSLLTSADFAGVLEPRTMIEREHKNRFLSLAVKNNAIDYVPRVDNISEGLGTFTLIQTGKEKIYDEWMPTDELKETSWTIFYGKPSTKDGASYKILVNPVDARNESFIYAPVPSTPSITFEIASSNYLNLEFSPAVKIVEVPYFPFDTPIYHSDGKFFSLDRYQGYEQAGESGKDVQYWIYQNYCSLMEEYEFLRRGSRTTRVLNTSVPLIPSPLQYSLVLPYLEQSRYILDTKLMHSDFYSSRFVYDAFSFSPDFERIVFTSSNAHCQINYTASAEPSSAISFEFSPTDYSYRKSSDFENVIVSTRNNEWTIISDPYIDYLRNGYNYDVKNKTLSTVYSLTVPPISRAITGSMLNPALGVVGGVSSLISGIQTAVSNELSINQKLASESAKSVSVSGCDNFSVSHAVSGNKLWHFTYELNPTMESMVDDLFYFYGYKRGYQGVPNATSRVWFNFVQCVPKWNPAFARSCKPFLDELGKKFQNGITFFHHHDVASQPSWMTYKGYDLDQKSENWETIITGV